MDFNGSTKAQFVGDADVWDNCDGRHRQKDIRLHYKRCASDGRTPQTKCHILMINSLIYEVLRCNAQLKSSAQEITGILTSNKLLRKREKSTHIQKQSHKRRCDFPHTTAYGTAHIFMKIVSLTSNRTMQHFRAISISEKIENAFFHQKYIIQILQNHTLLYLLYFANSLQLSVVVFVQCRIAGRKSCERNALLRHRMSR